MSELNEKGYSNLIEVFKDYTGLTISKEFIDNHIEKLRYSFPEKDDEFYKSSDEFPWWTFENESNSGGIFDTNSRDVLIDNLSLILFDMPWPVNGDSSEVHSEFEKRYKHHVSKEI